MASSSSSRRREELEKKYSDEIKEIYPDVEITNEIQKMMDDCIDADIKNPSLEEESTPQKYELLIILETLQIIKDFIEPFLKKLPYRQSLKNAITELAETKIVGEPAEITKYEKKLKKMIAREKVYQTRVLNILKDFKSDERSSIAILKLANEYDNLKKHIFCVTEALENEQKKLEEFEKPINPRLTLLQQGFQVIHKKALSQVKESKLLLHDAEVAFNEQQSIIKSLQKKLEYYESLLMQKEDKLKQATEETKEERKEIEDSKSPSSSSGFHP